MGTDQLWQQLEYRGKAIEKVLSEILVYAGGQDPNAEEEPDDELELKSKNKEAEEELDDAASEEIVNHLSSLSDAELKALGIDPELRDQLMADDDDGDFEPDANDDDEEEAYPEGYPGASDLSSDEDEEGYEPGSSKRVYLEPLKTEKEQRKKKEEQERRDMERQQEFAGLKQDMEALAEEDSDADEEDSDADEDDEMEEDEPSAGKAARKPTSLLDQLDEPGASTSGSGSSKRKG